jgi:hypothetical protein
MIRSLLGHLAFASITLVLAIVFIEVGSRFLFPAWAPASGDRDYWVYDELVGWRHRPNASGRFSYTDFDVSVEINSSGHRDDEYAPSPTPGRHRALLLGDSFGWGYGVEHDEIFAERIEARRNDWEIINASVSGYGTDQEYLYYRDRGHLHGAELVMLLFSGNDVANSAAPVQYWHNKPMFVLEDDRLVIANVPVPPPTIGQDVANWIARNTYFLRMASQVGAGWLAAQRAPDPPAQLSAAAAAKDPHAANARLAALSSDEQRVVGLLIALADEVQRHGARLVVIQPPGDVPLFDDPRLADAGIVVLPLTGVFDAASERAVFEHDPHWTAEGHRLVAEFVEEFMIEHGLFGAPDSTDPVAVR